VRDYNPQDKDPDCAITPEEAGPMFCTYARSHNLQTGKTIRFDKVNSRAKLSRFFWGAMLEFMRNTPRGKEVINMLHAEQLEGLPVTNIEADASRRMAKALWKQ
jgi:hypothetical protein